MQSHKKNQVQENSHDVTFFILIWNHVCTHSHAHTATFVRTYTKTEWEYEDGERGSKRNEKVKVKETDKEKKKENIVKGGREGIQCVSLLSSRWMMVGLLFLVSILVFRTCITEVRVWNINKSIDMTALASNVYWV